MYILDTNVISELRKVRAGTANANVARWSASVASSDLYLSVITIQELESGVLRIERKDPRQAAIYRSWLNNHVLPSFAQRILPVDLAIALRSAIFHVPNCHSVQDGLIAATALVHGMTVVTRNTVDFKTTGVQLLNPWN